LLDNTIDDHREGGQEIRAVNLRVEENLGGEETFVTDIDADLAAIGMRHNVLGKSSAVSVVLAKFLDNIRTDVAVLFLNLLSCLERRIGLAAVSQQGLNEVSDISTSNGN
jgi:hypothetical protein